MAEPGAGSWIITLDAVGTAALVAATALAAVADGRVTDLVNLAVSSLLFLGGCVAFGYGFLRAAGRSRTEVVDLAGLFYLTGSGPAGVRRMLLGLWFAQIAVASASVVVVRPPFGVMAPVWGIGLLSVWGALHGAFPARDHGGDHRRRGSAPQ
jgi:hypothetical protein